MRRRIGVLAVLTVTAGAAIMVGQSSPPDRRIGRDDRYTIASQLRSGDRHVVLEYNGTPPLVLGGPSQGESKLQWLAKQWPVIVVVSVERVDSVFVNRDREWREREVAADEANWIVSNVSARVVDVIKGANELGKTVGERVSLRMEGGTAMVRGTLVEAVVPWELAMVPRGRYLLFGRMYNGQFVKNYGYAESKMALLTRMTHPASTPPDALGRLQTRDADDVEQWTLEQAVQLIRSAANP
jgi:hypothetical protein